MGVCISEDALNLHRLREKERRPKLLWQTKFISRKAAFKAAMMPAYAPSVARRADPRKVKRTLPWQKSALRQAQECDMRPEAHVVEVRPPSSGYGKVAPSKNFV